MSTLKITGNPHGEITKKDVIVKPETPAMLVDDAALRLNVQDVARAEVWMGQKQWPLQWRESDILYQSPRTISTFEGGGGVTRANVSRFTVAKHVNTLVPMIMSGIFYDSPPFVIRPRPGATEATTRAKTALFGALMEEMEFKGECEVGIESQVLNGTGMWKRGWTVTREKKKIYRRKNAPATVEMPFEGKKQIDTAESDEFEIVEKVVTKSRPFFEHCPLGTVLIDPGWRHSNRPDKAKFLIHVAYVTFNDLAKLRQQEGYVIPSEEDLKSLCFAPVEIAVPVPGVEQEQTANTAVVHAEGRDQKTTEDPLEQPLRLDERWDKDRVITVLNGKLLIRNEEHKMGKIPFYSANWWNIQNSGFGLGVGRLVGADQRVEQGTMNAALDILAFGVNPQYARSRGANVLTQQIRSRLGGIVDVDGKIDEAFKLIETPKVPAEAWTAIQVSKQSGESTTGADEAFSQGSLPGKGNSSVARTATGAGGVMAANAGRIQGPVGRFVDHVFLPFLYDLDEMVRDRMPMSEIREILGDELGEEYKKEFDAHNFLNARLKFEVLAGAHLAAKKAMAQTLPLIIQLLENPHLLESLNQTGWTVDIKELFEMLMEMSEWKNTRQVIRKFNKEEAENYKQATQAAPMQKVQGDLMKIKAKHDATSAEIDQTAEARLASKLAQEAVDKGHAYEERLAVERSEDAAETGRGAQNFSAAQ
jgi:hypothetical protein